MAHSIEQGEEEDQRSLYLPQLERDACGIGMICHLKNNALHQNISDALTILENMEHRGACGAEADTGDGAGILCQMPHQFFLSCANDKGIVLPANGKYGVGFAFISPKCNMETILDICKRIIEASDFRLLFERNVPRDNSELGKSAIETEPLMRQMFVKPNFEIKNSYDFERKLYLLRNKICKELSKENYTEDDFYFSSFSSLTIIYKGMLRAIQMRKYFQDLTHPLFASAVAIVHSRFSTNTSPKWQLAQPFRNIAHNGEINTIRGNVNGWYARENGITNIDAFDKEEISNLFPICSESNSDSGNFDAVFEFLSKSGLSLPHTLMAMIPEAYQNDNQMPSYKKSFYQYYDHLMEPWDGPAAMCFTDGKTVGASLDRNGLRPLRFCVTQDDRIVISSETGALPLDQSQIVQKGNLSPGKIIIIDLDKGRLVLDEEVKQIVCNNRPYAQWLNTNVQYLKTTNVYHKPIDQKKIIQQQIASCFTKEDRDLILASMINEGQEAISSMGTDIPLAILSHQVQPIYNYFKQEFAQVTNPPIDPIREAFYMSLKCTIGGKADIFNITEENSKFIQLHSPVLDYEQYMCLLGKKDFKNQIIKSLFNSEETLREKILNLIELAILTVKSGTEIIIIDNTEIDNVHAGIPSLLAVGAVHQTLIKEGLRKNVSLIIKGNDVIEAHHFAALLSFGADAIFPSLTLDTIQLLSIENGTPSKSATKNYIKAVEKGILKIISKLGISTINSYKGAQTFEAIGIHKEVIDLCFSKTVSRIGGMTFEQLAKETFYSHQLAFNQNKDQLISSGKYQWRRDGEYHLFNPVSIHLLQHSTKTGDYQLFKAYSKEINNQSSKACTLRSLIAFKPITSSISIDQVESIESILKRFATGAMSFGSISKEAHETLALAMNKIGGKSNSGEGGEDAERYISMLNGESKRSSIKQVASGRFGVTIEYLNNADEIQIKMAQGAKPGEGGQLPGHKVDANIARIRHSTEGVGLISPPPHHDIYSIEDLAQLIFDLKNANPKARISVKLVAKAGVGIIASGVAKAHADSILISGHDGGTGASPLSSIMHAGIPWELGLAETHQTLIKNKLRGRVTLQTDGQLRTGRDLAIATLLGAEEWGIATAALVVNGCILMRKCHLNTCPVGIATQDSDLRKNFTGKVDHLINYFTFLAMELREIMADLGFKTVNEMVGQSHYLQFDSAKKYWKYENIDLSPLFYKAENSFKDTLYKTIEQEHGIESVIDKKLIQYSELAIKDKIFINTEFPIKNTDRSTGTMLSGQIAKIYGNKGLQKGAVNFRFRGSAGQSFGAFGVHGLHFTLEGEANDYFGKGLSGATLAVTPDRNSKLEPIENIIIGNVALFGATSGEIFVQGKAGERFAVRNSGANAVVEGVGDNACEYMTGGTVLILGDIGKNFAAGMSGGLAYIYNSIANLKNKINHEMVEMEILAEHDFESIRKLLRDHFTYTGSTFALEILTNWEESSKKFTKIIPTEYKNVLIKKGLKHSLKITTSHIVA
ncbi:MAG: Glutamate synthase large chain [Bacteroidota bacterium]